MANPAFGCVCKLTRNYRGEFSQWAENFDINTEYDTKERHLLQEKSLYEEKMKEFEEKSFLQIQVINKLNLKISQFKEQMKILIEEIKILNKEKECFNDELNYLKNEIED